jgi:hypothetical protein
MKTNQQITETKKEFSHANEIEITDRDIAVLRIMGVTALVAVVAGGALFGKHTIERNNNIAELKQVASSSVIEQGVEIGAPSEQYYNAVGTRIRTSEWVEVPVTAVTEEEAWAVQEAQPNYYKDYYGPSSIHISTIHPGGGRKGVSFFFTGSSKLPVLPSLHNGGSDSSSLVENYTVKSFSAPGFADTDEDLSKNILKVALPENALDGTESDKVFARMVMAFSGKGINEKKETVLEFAFPLEHKEFNVLVNVEKKS